MFLLSERITSSEDEVLILAFSTVWTSSSLEPCRIA